MRQQERMDVELFRLRDDMAKTMPTSSNGPHTTALTEIPIITLDKLYYCNFCPMAFDTEWERREHNQTEYEGKIEI